MHRKRVTRVIDIAIVLVGLGMAAYHLMSTQYLVFGLYEHQSAHLIFALTLVFLVALRESTGWSFYKNLAFLLAGIVVMSYILINYEYLEKLASRIPNTTVLTMAILLPLVVWEATRLAWGPILPVLVLIFIAYFFLGYHIPWPLGHMGYPTEFLLAALGIGFMGIFGIILEVSVNFVFLFMLFGGLLTATGALDFVNEIGRAVGRRMASGPAQMAVVGSGMIGTVTGTSVANVALTGQFTIPLMKKAGYHADVAGSIEAVASASSQIVPPVMGATAFVLAAFLGMLYVDVCIAAIIPAALYMISVFIGVEVLARKQGISAAGMLGAVDRRKLFTFMPIFVVPWLVIVIILALRYTPMYAAFYGVVAVIVTCYLRKETRLSLGKLVQGLVTGAKMGANIGVVLALIGIVYCTLCTTGVAVRLGGIVDALCGGNLFLGLLLCMLISLILGIGMTTTPAYVIAAIVVGPMLIRMGLEPLTAHMFCFYFAVISCLTPPVAMAALVASKIAGGNYWKTSIYAVRLALVGFLIPFLFAYNPVLLAQPMEPHLAVLTMIAVTMLLICIPAVLFGHLLNEVTLWQRGLFGLAAAGLFGYAFTHNYLLFGLGSLLFAGLMVLEWNKVRTQRRMEAGLPM